MKSILKKMKRMWNVIPSNAMKFAVLLLSPFLIVKHFHFESATFLYVLVEWASSIFWELIFVLLIIFLIERQATRRQEIARGPVHETAFGDAITIFGDVHHLINNVLKESGDDASENLLILNDRYRNTDTPWAVELRKEIHRILTESENYLQRFGGFLSSNETEDSGSNLLNTMSILRRTLHQTDRSMGKGQGNIGVRLQVKLPEDRKTGVVRLRVNEETVELGTIGALQELVASMEGYYAYANDHVSADLLRRDDDSILSPRHEHLQKLEADAGTKLSLTRALLERALDRLEVLFAGPEVWECLSDAGLETETAKKLAEVKPKSGIRGAWCNLGVLCLSRSIRKGAALMSEGSSWQASTVAVATAADVTALGRRAGGEMLAREAAPGKKEVKLNSYVRAAHNMIRQSSDAGSVSGRCALAALYFGGQTELADEDEAEEYLKEAASEGYVEAQLALGVMFRDMGEERSKEYVKQDLIHRDLMNNVHGYAGELEGPQHLFREAEGRFKEAAYWLDRASQQGEVEARVNLAEMAEFSLFSQREYCHYISETEYAELLSGCADAAAEAEQAGKIHCAARAWYVIARKEQRNPYSRGRGVPAGGNNGAVSEATERGLIYYREAASRGSVRAQYELGLSFLVGKLPYREERHDWLELEPDAAEAAHWFRRAKKSGGLNGEYDYYQERAAVELAGMHVEGRHGGDDPEDFRETFPMEWLRRLEAKVGSQTEKGQQDDCDHLFILGAVYRDGSSGQQDDLKAMECLIRAGYDENGSLWHLGALVRLGVMYRDGHRDEQDGTPVSNFATAREYFSEVASGLCNGLELTMGAGNAFINLSDMYDRGYLYVHGNSGKKRQPVEGVFRCLERAVDGSGDRESVTGDRRLSYAEIGRRIEEIVGYRARETKSFVENTVNGCCYKGLMYEEGWDQSEPADREKAEEWYRKAASTQWRGTLGHPDAEYRIGRICERRNEPDEGEEWHRRAARGRDGSAGHPQAQYRLGLMYERRREPNIAVKWYMMAADSRWYDVRGHAGAQYRLGKMWEKGWCGQEASYAKARAWYERAAESRWYDEEGHGAAQCALADLLVRQIGVRTSEAVGYYEMAGKQGSVRGAYQLGCAYEEGWLVLGGEAVMDDDLEKEKVEEHLQGTRNLGKAMEWYEEAAGKGCVDSQYRIGRLYAQGWVGQNPDPERAWFWLKKAAAGRHVLALKWARRSRADADIGEDADLQCALGWMYETRRSGGQDPDVEKAKACYRRAAEKGHADGQYMLGELMRAELRKLPPTDEYLAGLWGYATSPYGYADKDAAFFRALDEELQATMRRLEDHSALLMASLERDKLKYWQVGGEVKKWFRLASEPREEYKLGHPGALYRLARIHMEQQGSADYGEETMDCLWRACVQGHAEAAYKLGCAYEKGTGGKGREWAGAGGKETKDLQERGLNPEKAMELYRKAAARGHVDAQEALGWLYWKGWEGSKPNCERMMTYYQMATAFGKNPRDLGVPELRYHLGVMWELGCGVHRKDWRKAEVWYSSVANRRGGELPVNKKASYRLGRMYERGGAGLDACVELARKRYVEASGHSGAEYRLGLMCEVGHFGQGEDWKMAAEWYARAVRTHENECRMRTNATRNASSGSVDVACRREVIALEELEQPVAGSAEYRLGRMFAAGSEAFPGDEAEAWKWMLRSAEQGHEAAMHWLDDHWTRKPGGDARDGEH